MLKKIKNFFKIDNQYGKGFFTLFILAVLSFLIMVITLMFANPISSIDLPIFRSYFNSGMLMFMNYIPVFLFMSFVYLVFNRLWISFLSTSIVFVLLSIVNKFKLTYRDDPFTFIDIKLIKESIEMTNSYKIEFSFNIIVMFALLIIITIALWYVFNYKISSKIIRISLISVVLITSIIIFSGPYFNKDTYNKIGNKKLINIWSQTQQFQSKGFIYPFIYSIKKIKDVRLEGYDEEKAINVLNKYEYANIPDDKKINIIAIMLEAYNDFSKFDSIEFDIDPYAYFHKLQKESIHGNLITNVFAGNTVATERSFLAGIYNHPQYYKNTNSFVWYLNEEGYRTEAMHPIYGWFYNRRNINTYLGFDSFDYYENKYKDIQTVFLNDMDFFEYIIEGYEKSVEDNTPYFNFSVTYQNHGPYSTNKNTQNQYLKMKESYSEETYNIINNYLAGISETDKAIEMLIDYFSNKKEPTVVLLFGDHNPWFGQDLAGYKMLDINMDLSTIEGFRNYYETPYIIWGNDNAKKVLNNDMIGRRDEISPIFLMPELFDCFKWKGDEYMQYLRDYREYIDVNSNIFFKEEGKYTKDLSSYNQKRYEDFLNLEYYYSRNFIKE